MIIFGLFLTTFEASIIVKAAGSVLKISWSLKPNHHNQVVPVQTRETLFIFSFFC